MDRPTLCWTCAFSNVANRHANASCEVHMIAGLLLWTSSFTAAVADDATREKRPDNWAKPVKRDGVPNLFKVSEDVFRSAQPSENGFRKIKELGVATVVNLRSFHSDRDKIGDTGLAYEHLYMKAWHPEEKELVRFLQIVTNKRRTPILVHCQQGADRTGLMCAVYRVAVQGWTKEDAISEMKNGGYGFNSVWTNIVRYVRELDVEHIQKKAGLATKPKSGH